jgi:hypothetical protein
MSVLDFGFDEAADETGVVSFANSDAQCDQICAY